MICHLTFQAKVYFSHRFDGWVVCKEHEAALLAALDEYQAEEALKAEAKIEKRVYGNWKKLIKGVLIRERLRLRYGKGKCFLSLFLNTYQITVYDLPIQRISNE